MRKLLIVTSLLALIPVVAFPQVLQPQSPGTIPVTPTHPPIGVLNNAWTPAQMISAYVQWLKANPQDKFSIPGGVFFVMSRTFGGAPQALNTSPDRIEDASGKMSLEGTSSLVATFNSFSNPDQFHTASSTSETLTLDGAAGKARIGNFTANLNAISGVLMFDNLAFNPGVFTIVLYTKPGGTLH